MKYPPFKFLNPFEYVIEVLSPDEIDKDFWEWGARMKAVNLSKQNETKRKDRICQERKSLKAKVAKAVTNDDT